MEKYNFTDTQTAFEYALYMIAASYFNTAQCKSKRTERKMRLQYTEQREKQQYSMEDLCIAHMERLIQKIPSNLLQLNMDVYLRRNSKTNHTEIIFCNPSCIIRFAASYKGTRTKIKQEIWQKKILKKPLYNEPKREYINILTQKDLGTKNKPCIPRKAAVPEATS